MCRNDWDRSLYGLADWKGVWDIEHIDVLIYAQDENLMPSCMLHSLYCPMCLGAV